MSTEADQMHTLAPYEEKALRLTLKRLILKANPDMSMEDRESLLEEHLPLASTRYSEYEKAFANCRVGLLRLNALLRKMEKHLNNATNSAFEVKLFFAKLSRAKEEVKDLRSFTDLASQYWYNIGDEPSVMAFIDAADRLEELAVQGRDAAELHQLDLGRLSSGDNPSTTITVERERKPALHYDAARVIGLKFSGEGSPTDVLQQYSVFKRKWMEIKKDLEANFDSCSKAILFDKFKECLQGKAFSIANQAASYGLAMEELDKTFEDSFKLAKAYLDEVKPGLPIQEFQKSAKTAMYQVNQILEDALEKGVRPIDFLLITFINEKLPARAVADWEAVLIGKEEEHKRKNVLEGTDLLWKPGSILNIKDFNVWLEAYATRHKDVPESEGSLNVFSATEVRAKCVIHGDVGHSTEMCNKALSHTRSEWTKTCLSLKKCSLCLAEYSSEHERACNAKCPLCAETHNVIVCEKNPNRRRQDSKHRHRKRFPDKDISSSKPKRPAMANALQELVESQQATDNRLKAFMDSQRKKSPPKSLKENVQKPSKKNKKSS